MADMTVDEFVPYLARWAQNFAGMAGVGGMETAGTVISYLAAHPESIPAFIEHGLVGLPDDPHEWIFGGNLSWQGRDGKVYDPAWVRARRSRQAKIDAMKPRKPA